MTEALPWYVEHGIANGHPTDRVIRVLQFLAVGHGYIHVIVLRFALSVC
jgi:hypothetical protein